MAYDLLNTMRQFTQCLEQKQPVEYPAFGSRVSRAAAEFSLKNRLFSVCCLVVGQV
jgi:hypothetical protein